MDNGLKVCMKGELFMFFEFLENCHCVFTDETSDFESLKVQIKNSESLIAYMPSITVDLWPIHVLEEMNFGKSIDGNSSPRIYIAPLGSHDFLIKNELELIINSFYQDENIKNNQNYYGASLEEMLILKSDEIKETFENSIIGSTNVIYARISLQNHKDVHFFGIYDFAEEFWKNIIEKYNIKVSWIIDSHKGLGDWFENVPLYKIFLETNKPRLLPRFYLKGKFISHDAPEGFELISELKENENDWIGTHIYRTIWNL